MKIRLINEDCKAAMAAMKEGSVGGVICDPPYGLKFMGKEFDKLGEGAAQKEWHLEWLREAFRVLRPGGVIKAFGGTRTYHHLAAAMEDAGFVGLRLEAWAYGSGFPKSLDIGKAIDKEAGVERQVVGLVKGMGKQNPEWNGTAKGRTENSFKPEYELTAPTTKEAQKWNGWGTALKPAWEPVVIGVKP